MKLIFKELGILASPICLIEGFRIELSERSLLELEIDESFTASGRISRRSATKSRFEFFAQKTEDKPSDNWGFVAVRDSRRSLDFEIGLEGEVFDNLIDALKAFGPQNAQIEGEFLLSEFVPDIREGRGAVLACAPTLWIKGTGK